jgi:hypothetical protein
VIEDICSFPVTITATLVGTETTFYDQSGAVTRIKDHVVEQDVFSANDETLTGLPFTFNIQVLFEDGEVTHVYASGLVERVPLPDGTVFSRPAVWTSPHIRGRTSASSPMSDAQETWQRSVRRLHPSH